MAHRPAHVIARVALAVLGGYAVTSAIVALLSVALPAFAGMVRSEAVLLSSMLGFVVYVAVVIWAFAHPRLLRTSLYFLALVVVSVALVMAINARGLA